MIEARDHSLVDGLMECMTIENDDVLNRRMFIFLGRRMEPSRSVANARIVVIGVLWRLEMPERAMASVRLDMPVLPRHWEMKPELARVLVRPTYVALQVRRDPRRMMRMARYHMARMIGMRATARLEQPASAIRS